MLNKTFILETECRDLNLEHNEERREQLESSSNRINTEENYSPNEETSREVLLKIDNRAWSVEFVDQLLSELPNNQADVGLHYVNMLLHSIYILRNISLKQFFCSSIPLFLHFPFVIECFGIVFGQRKQKRKNHWCKNLRGIL